MRVLVIGAGVVGLTCAARLLEDGHDVHVLARDLPAETTSAVAAAWWYPYLAEPRDRVLAWSRRTFEVLSGLASADGPVTTRRSYDLVRGDAIEPWWSSALPGVRRTTDVPTGWSAAWTFDAPVVAMEPYLADLVRRLEAGGGTLTRAALPALPSGADVVVNASGMGARLLADDAAVRPVRGQVVRVAPCGVDDVWLDADDPEGPTYVVPRGHDVVVGGTEEVGDWRLAPDPATTRRILARATRMVPAVAGAQVLSVRVGLRPSRPSVRLEVEHRDGASPVVHCYGHGGAGVTLSWGCADEVAALVATL